MRRMDKKGFILTETLVVSVVLLVAFVFIFTQFLTIFASYKLFESYKNVDALYTSVSIERFITQDNLDNLVSELTTNKASGIPYYEFTDCSSSVFDFSAQCTVLINESNVARAFIVDYNLSNLAAFNYSNDFSYRLKKYIEFLAREKESALVGDYRIIVEMEDGGFSSKIIDPTIALPSKDQYSYKPAYLSFDGNDDYLSLPDDLGYRTAVSVFAWFKHNGTPLGDAHVITGGQELELSVNSTGNLTTGVYTDARYVASHGEGLLDGSWHYIGLTYDGSNVRSYIDGELVGTESAPGTLTYIAPNRAIGRFGSSTTYYTNGIIKEFVVYNRDLSIVEINNNMNDINKDIDGLVAYYKLSEGQGTTLYDYSGNHSDSTNAIIGAAWITEDNYSEWIDGVPNLTMYPEVETRTVYFYLDRWLTQSSIEYIFATGELDNESPSISLNGSEEMYINLNGTYNEPGAIAIDNVDGDISSNIQIIGDVDTSKEGIYTITYSVADSMGNIATATRTVRIVQSSFTFTPAGQTGQTGPTQAQIDIYYTGTSLAGNVTVIDGIQRWTVPYTGTYNIQVFGASGGAYSTAYEGKGAKITGDFTLTAGDVLMILVGQKGGYVKTTNRFASGGGGGSYVMKVDSNSSYIMADGSTKVTPLIVAGGGGGGYTTYSQAVRDAVTTDDGVSGSGASGSGAAGIDGNSSTSGYAYGGYGGGGFLPDTNISYHGRSFLSGGAGGYITTYGGFGGGGGARYYRTTGDGIDYDYRYRSGGGGGGGWSGGGAAYDYTTDGSAYNASGGGGSSYNNGENQSNEASVNVGDGQVIIQFTP